MRILIKEKIIQKTHDCNLGYRILKDRSPFGLPRLVVEEIGIDGRWLTTKVFSKLWYNLKTVEEIMESQYG